MAVGEGRARGNRSLLGTRIAGLGASSFLPQEMLRQEVESDVHCVILYREIGTFLIAPDFRMIIGLKGVWEMLSPIFIISENLGQRIFFLSNIPTLLICFSFLGLFFHTRIFILIDLVVRN